MLSNIPEPTLRRLPQYLLHLKAVQGSAVSCAALAHRLRLDPSQIRKDFAKAGVPGKPRVGYSVKALRDAFRRLLGWGDSIPALLAGADALGCAVLACSELRQSGLEIVGVFDCDPVRIGRSACGHEVQPLAFLPDAAAVRKIRVGIIALTADNAQVAADLMLQAGMDAIWNLAPVALRTPAGVVVENADLCSSFAALSMRLAGRPKVVTAVHSNLRKESETWRHPS